MSGNTAPSGKFLLRLPPPLHARLAAHAHSAGLSLNEYCVRALSREEASRTGPFGEAVGRCIEQLGSALIGVAVFGSYARGEATADSDVDLLVAVSSDVPIRRPLYSAWDGDALRIGPHRVEPHFVHLPAPEERHSGFWAEVALDGNVIWDPDLALTRRLIGIRRALVDGCLVRRSSGGRTWWTAA
jgi:predicted nucleotidyltransferase